VSSLFVIRGNDQGLRFELELPVVSLGRDLSSTIQLHDTEVSRQHAEIRRTGDRYAIVDLRSSNGTFVNGRKMGGDVAEQYELFSGDQIQLGGTLMLFTGPTEETPEDIASTINIGQPLEGERSNIIRSMAQEEGSRFFEIGPNATQDPWLNRARSNLQVMYRTALAVSHTLDIGQLLDRIMDLIFEWVEADRGCVMLINPATKVLEPKVRRTRTGVESEDRITISKTILDFVTERNEGVLTSDARQDERWDSAASIVRAGIREAICVPMRGRYDMVGMIYIDTSISPQKRISSNDSEKFTEDHLKLMIAIAHQAALAVEDTRYYSAMVQAEKLAAIGQTITTLSHHIKNILQGIRGGSYLIELGLSDNDQSVVRRAWKILEKNQNKISSFVMDMLTFSKEREPDLKPAEINAIVDDAVELMQTRGSELKVQLRWQPDKSIPKLVFDPDGIGRAVLNVLTNAIDAAAEENESGGGQVGIRTEFTEKATRVIVEDNGPGIAPESIDGIFSPFVSSKKGRGTGLGLPVSRKILNEHDGQILVSSEPGGGAKFTLELPTVLACSDSQANDDSQDG